MAYPPAYSRAYSFTDFETNNPGQPKPGNKLDTEYDAVANALTGTQNALALIQRADGALANASVGVDQLQPGLFDGIGNAAAADAQASADAAAASASASATSAGAASTSASNAATDAAVAAGSAAQAGTSQSIAQGAADDCAALADDAAASATASQTAANSVVNSVSEAQLHEDTAFKWAEYLAAPVAPAPPGWPEAVDDGMFSSKWWAIRARDYNATTTIDLGTAGTDVGNAFDIWNAIPGNDLGIGQTYATWGSPTQTYVLIDRSNPSNPASWQNITGGPGPPGPPNTLTAGTIGTGAPGSAVIVSITGASPNQVLNMTIPAGATGGVGPAGPVGPPNALAIGTVTTVPDGTPSAATITGTAPTQTLNLTLTAGPQGIQGIQGIPGPVGPAANLGNPTVNIGLATVNGVAATAMRSDAAPALSQAIAPTWTAEHKFSGTLTGASFTSLNGISISLASATEPVIWWRRAASAADAKNWAMFANPASWDFVLYDDTGANQRGIIQAARVGGVLSSMSFGNATDNPLYNFLGSGGATFNGPITTTGAVGRRMTIDSSAAGGAYTTFTRGGVAHADIGNGGQFGGTFSLDALALSARAGNPIQMAANGVTVPQWVLNTSGNVVLTGTQLGPNGSAAAPAYSFTSDPDTGIWGTGANVLAISTGGVIRAFFDTAALYLQSGTAALPSLSFMTDGVTGMYRSGASTVAFAGGGVRGFQVDGGHAYIEDGSAGGPSLAFNNDLDTGIWRPGANRLAITAGGVTIVDVDRGGTNTIAINIPALFADGAVGGPSISFSSDTNTGIFHAGPDVLSIVSGGLVMLQFFGTSATAVPRAIMNTPFCLVNGTAAAPALTFEGDLDTGVYRSNADEFAIATGGVRRAVIFASGIQLDTGAIFVPNGNAALPAYNFGTDTNNGMYLSGTDEIAFSTGGVGRVSIGTALVSSNIPISAPSFTSTSSRAIKRETGKPHRAADLLSRLRPIFYRLLEGGDDEQLGLIAEEVHEVCPQLSDGKTVAYDRLALLLLADWQETRMAA